MKILCAVGVLCGLIILSGCTVKTAPTDKTHWDYTSLTIENYEHDAIGKILQKTPVDMAALKFSEETMGQFSLPSKEMRELGEDGWELVSAVPMIQTTHPAGEGACQRTGAIFLIFKRPK